MEKILRPAVAPPDTRQHWRKVNKPSLYLPSRKANRNKETLMLRVEPVTLLIPAGLSASLQTEGKSR